MGNEGELLSTMADAFMEENPDVNVEVTPIAWDQAVTRLQTAIGGGQTPCVSQMGTDMMGQFVATGAIDPVGEGIDPSAFFEGAWNSNIVDGTAYGVPWYVETRVLYERTDIAEKAGITEAAGDVGRPHGDRQGDEGAGRRRMGHRPRHQELPGVRPVPVVERRRHHERGRRVHPRQPRSDRSPDVLRLVLRGRPRPAARCRRASTSRRPL